MSKPPQIHLYDKRGHEYGPFHWKHVVEWHELDLLNGFTWKTSGGVSKPISSLVDALGVPPSIMTRSILLAPPEDAPDASAESMAELHAAGFPVSIGPIPEETQKHIAEQMSLPDPMLDAEDADFQVGNPFAAKPAAASEPETRVEKGAAGAYEAATEENVASEEEALSDPEAATAPETATNQEAAPEPEALAEPEAAAEPEAPTEPTEPDAVAKPEVSSAQKFGPESGAGQNSTVESEAEPDQELEAEPLREAESAPLSDSKPETDPDSTVESEEILEKPNDPRQVGEKAEGSSRETADAEPNEIVGDSPSAEADSPSGATAQPTADAATDPAMNIFLEGEEVDPSEASEPDEIEAKKKSTPILPVAAALLIAIGGGVALFLLNQNGSAGGEVAAPAPVDTDSEEASEVEGTRSRASETAASAPSEEVEEVRATPQVDAPEEAIASSQATDLPTEEPMATEAPMANEAIATNETSAVTEESMVGEEPPTAQELANTTERSNPEESSALADQVEPEAPSQGGITVDSSPSNDLAANGNESDEAETIASVSQAVATTPSPDPTATTEASEERTEASEEATITRTETQIESSETDQTEVSATSQAAVTDEAQASPPVESETAEDQSTAVAASRGAEPNTTNISESASDEAGAEAADSDDERAGRRERLVEEFPDYVPSF